MEALEISLSLPLSLLLSTSNPSRIHGGIGGDLLENSLGLKTLLSEHFLK